MRTDLSLQTQEHIKSVFYFGLKKFRGPTEPARSLKQKLQLMGLNLNLIGKDLIMTYFEVKGLTPEHTNPYTNEFRDLIRLLLSSARKDEVIQLTTRISDFETGMLYIRKGYGYFETIFGDLGDLNDQHRKTPQTIVYLTGDEVTIDHPRLV